MARVEKIPTGSRWRRGSDPRVIRVMGTVEGWVIARLKGRAPFMLHENDWARSFVPYDAQQGEVA